MHTPIDDRESVFHSFLWTGLRYLRHNLDPVNLHAFLAAYDEMSVRDGGAVVSNGNKRRQVFMNGGPPDVTFDLEPLNDLVEELCWMFSVRYEKRNTKMMTPAEVVMQDERDITRRANLSDPKWLVGVLREAQGALWSLREANPTRGKAGNIAALDDNALTWAQEDGESDWVNNVLSLKGVTVYHVKAKLKYDLVHPWDGYGLTKPWETWEGDGARTEWKVDR